jgi:hypothetical protein
MTVTIRPGTTVRPSVTVKGFTPAGGEPPVTYIAGAGADYSVPGIVFSTPGYLTFTITDFDASARGIECRTKMLSKNSGDSFVINSQNDVGPGPWTATLTGPWVLSGDTTQYSAPFTASVVPFMYSWEITI